MNRMKENTLIYAGFKLLFVVLSATHSNKGWVLTLEKLYIRALVALFNVLYPGLDVRIKNFLAKNKA